ncbi:MAG TPA: Abi-alpha family protein, partial [Solirubrobacterales bacterium]|nr:Abi-alpha family protein [Solirubrobacterales bacterium]
MSDPRRPKPDPDAPTPAEVGTEVAELVRIAASTWWRGASRTAEVGLVAPARFAAGVIDAAARPGAAAAIDAARDQRDQRGESDRERDRSDRNLRERGAELLRRSADLHDRDDQHPAYRRILEELAPDEARILRLLVADGPQPTVDVRAGLRPASRLVSAGHSMLGADAGCRNTT